MSTSRTRKVLWVVVLAVLLGTSTYAIRDFLLRRAAGACSASAVKLLMAMGADPGAAGVQGTPLHHAVRCRDIGLVEILLDHGADIDGRNLNGYTPLALASGMGDRPLVAFLLDRGANINGSSPDTAPLTAATRANRAAVAKDLLARGAKPMLGAGSVVNELHIAAGSDAADVIPLLVAAGVPLDTVNQLGDTPIFRAARRDARTLSALIQAGAKVNLRNNRGATPLTVAIDECRPANVGLLIAAGADVNVRGERGESLQELAGKCANGGEIIRMLSSPRTPRRLAARRCEDGTL